MFAFDCLVLLCVPFIYPHFAIVLKMQNDWSVFSASLHSPSCGSPFLIYPVVVIEPLRLWVDAGYCSINKPIADRLSHVTRNESFNVLRDKKVKRINAEDVFFLSWLQVYKTSLFYLTYRSFKLPVGFSLSGDWWMMMPQNLYFSLLNKKLMTEWKLNFYFYTTQQVIQFLERNQQISTLIFHLFLLTKLVFGNGHDKLCFKSNWSLNPSLHLVPVKLILASPVGR